MRTLLAATLCLAIAWQALSAGTGMARRMVRGTEVGWRERFLATTGQRIERALGADLEVYRAVRERVPEGAILLTARPSGTVASLQDPSIDLEAEARKQGTLQQLRNLLYPSPFPVRVENPIAAIESGARAGIEPWLLCLPGDATPKERAGWTLIARGDRFGLWTYRKD
ncbi:MAG: hypothetical protein Fur0037_29120 [Planctomycetota bacterium]